MANRAGAEPAVVTSSTSEEWRGFEWVEPELVTYKARDGATVYARLYTPEMVGAKRHPSQPAVDLRARGRLSAERAPLLVQLLQGVHVSSPAGLARLRRPRSRLSRQRRLRARLADGDLSGGWAATISTTWWTARPILASAHRVDPKRIGVYGGSYGGFITLMAMFTSPDIFAAGAALRPVTDWAHYNHPYTANILDEPQSAIETYRKSSPIYFAEGLKGALLICHGMVDVNVHFQDSVRLAQRLIELRKENWELAVYPVEDHGFVEATSWADEYKRILKLFEDEPQAIGWKSCAACPNWWRGWIGRSRPAHVEAMTRAREAGARGPARGRGACAPRGFREARAGHLRAPPAAPGPGRTATPPS